MGSGGVLLAESVVVPFASPPLSPTASRAAGAALIGGLYVAHASIFGDYVADDAGISLAYGRNMMSGNGPVLYPGGEAVEAYSNPLWTALLGVASASGLDGADGVPLLKGLSLLFGLATVALAATAARYAYPDRAAITWLAPALLASLTPFVFWTASGMENALYAFVMLLAFVLQLRELNATNVAPWSAVAIAALALTRPEGIAFAAAFLVHRVLAGERGRRLVVWGVVIVGAYALFLASRVIIYGDWVPNTYYAKVALYDRHLSSLVGYLRDPDDRGTRHLLENIAAVWPLVLIAAVGLLDPRRWRAALLIAGVLAGTALYVVYVGGDFWPAGRFFTAALPLLALAVQHAVNTVHVRHARVGTVAAAVLVGVTLNQSLQTSAGLRVLHDGNALISLQGRLETARRLQALAHALGIEDPVVLDPDIGGLAVAGLRIVDLGGLADIHIARFHWHPPFFRDYVFDERRPDFIRTHATWTASTGITAFAEFDADYVAIRSWHDALGLHGEFVRREHLEPPDGTAVRREPQRPPSWRQAIDDGRARRRREDARAMSERSANRRDVSAVTQ